MSNTAITIHQVTSRMIDETTARMLGRFWLHFHDAPTDGTSVLAFGIHDKAAPEGASPQVRSGDPWWAIIQFDIWRSARQGGRCWVFAKDGSPVWSRPLRYMPLPASPFGESRE